MSLRRRRPDLLPWDPHRSNPCLPDPPILPSSSTSAPNQPATRSTIQTPAGVRSSLDRGHSLARPIPELPPLPRSRSRWRQAPPMAAAASVLDHQAVPLIPLPVPFSLKPPLPFPHDLSLCSRQRRLGGFLKDHGRHLARSAGCRRAWSRLARSAPCLVPGPAIVLIRQRAPPSPRSSVAAAGLASLRVRRAFPSSTEILSSYDDPSPSCRCGSTTCVRLAYLCSRLRATG